MEGACWEATGALMGAPLESGKGTHHDQQPLTARWTGVTRAEEWAPGLSCLWRWFRSSGRGGSCVPRQAELELVPERTIDRTPHAIVADVVEALGHHLREKAADERIGGEGHGPPAPVVGVLVAEAHLACRDREETVGGQGDALDSPGPGRSGLAQDLAPSVGHRPPILWSGPILAESGRGVLDAPERETGRETASRGHGQAPSRTGGPPLAAVGGAPTGWHKTGHVWMIDAGPSPGVEDAEHADEPRHHGGLQRA
jgi:hypothetical protein